LFFRKIFRRKYLENHKIGSWPGFLLLVPPIRASASGFPGKRMTPACTQQLRLSRHLHTKATVATTSLASAFKAATNKQKNGGG
jgi:hypothetical protein